MIFKWFLDEQILKMAPKMKFSGHLHGVRGARKTRFDPPRSKSEKIEKFDFFLGPGLPWGPMGPMGPRVGIARSLVITCFSQVFLLVWVPIDISQVP